MNRRTKIIISVVGILIVIFALIGLTYAYFLTRINGNSSDKSVSIVTANLELTYGDGNGLISETNIGPGTVLNSKTFTVTNDGNVDILTYGVGLVNLINSFERNEDLVYTLTCNSSIEGKTCNGVEETIFPKENSYIVENGISVGETQSYELKVTYKETGDDQSVDMNKVLSAKVDIFDPVNSVILRGNVTGYEENDYVVINSKEQTSEIIDGKYRFIGIEPDNHMVRIKNKENTTEKSAELKITKGQEVTFNENNITFNKDNNVADINLIKEATLSIDIKDLGDGSNKLKNKIIANSKLGKNGTIYSTKPLTSPANEISTENESTLSEESDNYGTTYFFRGNVKNNYVSFVGMCWRIVRIAGDESIKLILEDKDEVCSSSMNGNWDIGTGNFGYEKKNVTNSAGLVSSNQKYIMNYLNPTTNSYNAMSNIFKRFQTAKLNKVLDKLKSGDWCMNDKAYANYNYASTPLKQETIQDNYYSSKSFFYDSYIRLKGKDIKEPTLKCNGTIMNKFGDNTTDMYVGTLTSDEIVYAGGKVDESNSNYYLINDYHRNNSKKFWWTLTPYFFGSDSSGARVIAVRYNGYLEYSGVSGENVTSTTYVVRPSISLRSGIEISSGNGTIENSYIVE